MVVIDTPKSFGDLVRSRRHALGMTQRDLALAVNVGERFIVDLEGGKSTCQLGKALAVARAVGVRLTDGASAPLASTPPGDAYPDLPDFGSGA
ncbi:helix-turn-helix transcriptional regulator [Azospirillum sp. RWY-5-1]|uniref:Helix-turn-helix transcriptional regulator n=1 Tax=Azospirillum oleiclasticum TaxID=2735135 RepID=A0ABX2TAF8_9PROT|nr:helix-turn-helix domain-containing protein [Azospirillum oleiclasticum]NYZ13625.1 helix-turn-helix transcriptional regulator [Azospirillum oleiclasticum]NYZ20785.1 helix-turn-helix transcriptional regulator [Azospirillum oleiclasticum]